VHRRAPHTRVHKGKKVLVLLRDGTRLVDKFQAYTSTTIVLDAYGAVAKADLPLNELPSRIGEATMAASA
jgi:hypothetical protein